MKSNELFIPGDHPHQRHLRRLCPSGLDSPPTPQEEPTEKGALPACGSLLHLDLHADPVHLDILGLAHAILLVLLTIALISFL